MILKLSGHNNELETEFELKFLRSLSVRQRFELMWKKSMEMKRLLGTNGHGKTSKIFKRA